MSRDEFLKGLEEQAAAERDVLEAVDVLVQNFGYSAEDIENLLVEKLTEIREESE